MLANLLDQSQLEGVECGTFYPFGASHHTPDSATLPNKYLRKDSLLDTIV
jgi:hypothetical protein